MKKINIMCKKNKVFTEISILFKKARTEHRKKVPIIRKSSKFETVLFSFKKNK